MKIWILVFLISLLVACGKSDNQHNSEMESFPISTPEHKNDHSAIDDPAVTDIPVTPNNSVIQNNVVVLGK